MGLGRRPSRARLARVASILLIATWTAHGTASAQDAPRAGSAREREEREEEARRLAHALALVEDDKREAAFQALLELGDLCRSRGRVRGAIEAYEHALAIAPGVFDEVQLLSTLAHCDIQIGEIARATGRLHRAADLDPEDALVRNNLGYALHLAGSDVLALEELERCLALDPASTLPRITLGQVARLAGRPADALATHRSLHERAARGTPLGEPGGEWFYAFESAAGRARGQGALFATEPARRALVLLQVAVDHAFLDDLPAAEAAVAEARASHARADLLPAVDKALDDLWRALELRPAHFQLRYVASLLLDARGDRAAAAEERRLFLESEARLRAVAERAASREPGD